MKNCPVNHENIKMFPFKRHNGFDLPKEYSFARSSSPIFPVTLWNNQRAWLITRYRDFRKILLDERFSGQFSNENFPTVTKARQAIDKLEKAFVGMDNPHHGHYRRMFTKEFTTKRMNELIPKIEKITDNLLDNIAKKGPVIDLVPELAVELPAMVMCELFGSPYEDRHYILKCAAGRHGLSQSVEDASKSANDLVEYCQNLIINKSQNLKNDMLSRVIKEYVFSEQLSVEELANICSMILRAGHDTTTNMISLGTLLFLNNKKELKKFIQDSSTNFSAIEELLRFLSPVQFAPRRVALEDLDFMGVNIKKGEGIFALIQSANRDELAFEKPDKFDICRNANNHVTFGFGIHTCLGQGLARIELQIVFRKLFQRFPNLKIEEKFNEISFKYDSQIYGIYRLPVSW